MVVDCWVIINSFGCHSTKNRDTTVGDGIEEFLVSVAGKRKRKTKLLYQVLVLTNPPNRILFSRSLAQKKIIPVVVPGLFVPIIR